MTNAKHAKLTARANKVLCNTYNRYPISIARGKGSKLYDLDGKEYIDLLAGIAVTSIGHANPEITAALSKQADKFLHVSNLFYQEEQVLLAEKLLSTAPHAGKVFFCNSGAEANEAAIKLARRYQQTVKNKEAYEVITLKQAFHGRTLATVAATGNAKFQEGFLPMPAGFKQVGWGDLKIVEESISPQTAAIMLETVQGEGGIRPVSREYAQGLAALCKKHDLLLIVDEVQTGLCRCGTWWSFQHYGFEPDIFTVAKALANGLPMGAIVATENVATAFSPGSHGSTFGGNAICSTAALVTLEIMERDKLAERAAELGNWAKDKLLDLSKKHVGKIKEVRGLGLLIGVELGFDDKNKAKKVWEELLTAGIIINLTQENVLRLVPALTIEKSEFEKFFTTLDKILTAVV